MIQYEGMKAEESKSEGFGQLPVGAYVGVCLDARVEGLAPDQSLILALDVDEGEYKEFYMKKYLAAKNAGSKYGEVKFKGTYRLRIPNPDNKNAQYPDGDVRRMNDMIFKFENCNPGFHWDMDETKLKGLKVGFSTQEDSYNGNTFTRIGRLEKISAVKAGEVRPMQPRKRDQDPMALPPSQTPIDHQSGMPVINTVELPF